MPNEPRPDFVPSEFADNAPWIQVAPDVIDLGTADSKESFGEWCREQHDCLQQLRQQLDAHEDIAPHSIRYPSAVALQCCHLWRVLGGGDDVLKCTGIPAEEMDAFLHGIVICSKHHPFTSSAARYIEDVQRFLRQAMAWCEQEVTETDPPSDYKFALVGAVWHLRFDGETADLSKNDYVGLGFIAQLLARPHQEIAGTVLMRCDPAATDKPADQTTFDADGLAKVQEQARRLADQMEEARALGQHEKFADLEEAAEVLQRTHAKDKTRCGKPRSISRSPEQRAAEAARGAIKRAIGAIAKNGMPRLASHLKSIKLEGVTSLIYRPKGLSPVWATSPANN